MALRAIVFGPAGHAMTQLVRSVEILVLLDR